MMKRKEDDEKEDKEEKESGSGRKLFASKIK